MKKAIEINLTAKMLCKFIKKLNDTGDCIEWSGGLKNGYGAFYNKGKILYAHRVAYYIYNGNINNSLVIDHKCMNKRCVNPLHLREVTQKVNSLENNNGIFALNSRKTHCKNGHEFSEENTRFRIRLGSKTRYCLSCLRIKNAKRKKQ